EAVEHELARVTRERLGTDGHDPRPDVLAATAASTIRVAIQRWTADTTAGLPEHIESAFDVLIGALNDPAPPRDDGPTTALASSADAPHTNETTGPSEPR